MATTWKSRTRFRIAHVLLLMLFLGLAVQSIRVVRLALEGMLGANWIVFSADGRSVAAGLGRHRISAWDASTGCQLAQLEVEESRGGIFGASWQRVVCLPRAEQLLALKIGSLIRWDLGSGQPSHAHLPAGLPGVISPDGTRLAMKPSPGILELWEVGAGQALVTLPLRNPQSHALLAFSSDGNTFAVADYQAVDTYDLPDGVLRQSIPMDGWAGAASPDLRWVARTDRTDPTLLHVCSLEERSQRLEISQGAMILRETFAPDGSKLAVADDQGKIGIWEIPSGRLLAAGRGFRYVNALAFSPDGSRLAVGVSNGVVLFPNASIRIVDSVSLKQQAVLWVNDYRPQAGIFLAALVVGILLWRRIR